MGSLTSDLRFGLRVLRKSPGFAVTAIVTLALGIGANAVVFGVLNALILRPLNVPQAETLYELERASDKLGIESYPILICAIATALLMAWQLSPLVGQRLTRA